MSCSVVVTFGPPPAGFDSTHWCSRLILRSHSPLTRIAMVDSAKFSAMRSSRLSILNSLPRVWRMTATTIDHMVLLSSSGSSAWISHIRNGYAVVSRVTVAAAARVASSTGAATRSSLDSSPVVWADPCWRTR